MIKSIPATGLAFRFRGYTTQYASLINFMRKENPKAAAELITTMLAFSGTAGIPAFDFVRGQLADKFKVYVPPIEPLTQVTGADFGRSVDPWFTWPKHPSEFLGPLYGPIIEGISAAFRGDRPGVAFSAQRLMGPFVSRTLQAGAEALRGGETRTAVSRQLLARRDLETIGKSALGFAPAPRQARGEIQRELELAIQAGDLVARRRLLAEARRQGLTNIGMLVSQAKARVKRSQTQGLFSTILGE